MQTVVAREMLSSLNCIVSEFPNIDLSCYVKNVLYCQKIACEVILKPIKDQHACSIIKEEVKKYFAKIEKLAEGDLIHIKADELFKNNLRLELDKLNERLKIITETNNLYIRKAPLFPKSSGLEAEVELKLTHENEGYFDIGSIDLKNLTDKQRIKYCKMEHQSYEGKEKPVYIEIQKGKTVTRRVSDAVINANKPWLVLSTKLNGYMCLQCSLFLNGNKS